MHPAINGLQLVLSQRLYTLIPTSRSLFYQVRGGGQDQCSAYAYSIYDSRVWSWSRALDKPCSRYEGQF